MRLYEIAPELAGLVAQLDEATAPGSDVDLRSLDADILQHIGALEWAIEEKSDALVGLIREAKQEARAAKEEAARVAARGKAAEAREQHLRAYLMQCLQAANIRTVRGTRGTVSVRESEALTVGDESSVPDVFATVQTVRKIDRRALQAHYRETGEVPEGCGVETTQTLTIR